MHLATRDFRREVSIQSNLFHEKITRIVAICLHPMVILTEYCSFGDLFAFLNDKSQPFPWELRLKMLQDIAEV